MAFFYLSALAVLLVSAFWSINGFTLKLEHTWTLSNFSSVIHSAT